jgi:hypothetical protein
MKLNEVEKALQALAIMCSVLPKNNKKEEITIENSQMTSKRHGF